MLPFSPTGAFPIFETRSKAPLGIRKLIASCTGTTKWSAAFGFAGAVEA